MHHYAKLRIKKSGEIGCDLCKIYRKRDWMERKRVLGGQGDRKQKDALSEIYSAAVLSSRSS